MSEVKVKTAELVVTTVKLTAKILKQIPRLDYRQIDRLGFIEKGHIKPEVIVGWIHGAAMGDEWKRFFLLRTGEGSYGLIETTKHEFEGTPQIYVG